MVRCTLCLRMVCQQLHRSLGLSFVCFWGSHALCNDTAELPSICDTTGITGRVPCLVLCACRYGEVEQNCNRAVWVYQQINQPSNSRPVITATTMQALALVLLGRASEAEQLATSCLEAARQLPGPVGERNSFVASCYNCLGEVYREMGRLAESEAAAREGLAMREKVRLGLGVGCRVVVTWWHGARSRSCSMIDRPCLAVWQCRLGLSCGIDWLGSAPSL